MRRALGSSDRWQPARAEHAEAAARRLALLTADLDRAGVAASDPVPPEGEEWGDYTRVVPARRAVPPAPENSPGAPSEPPLLPRPGRHAARRRLQPLAGVARLPRLGAAHVAVVAILVAAGLAVTTWWVVRDRAAPGVPAAVAPVTDVDPLVASAEDDVLVTDASPSAEATASAGTVTVDVTGKVRRPGIVVLDTGSRVVDALDAAGGARPSVDLASLNLARVLVDGEQIVVGVASATIPVAPTGSTSPGAPAALVNLNTATAAELEALPEVGPVTAQAILTWRDEHGGFTSVDELLEVDGIGEVTLEQVAPYVTV